jgi:hypothetical protein
LLTFFVDKNVLKSTPSKLHLSDFLPRVFVIWVQ